MTRSVWALTAAAAFALACRSEPTATEADVGAADHPVTAANTKPVECTAGERRPDPGEADGPLVWDHAFHCVGAAESGVVSWSNFLEYPASDRARGPITIESLVLEKVTPGPLARDWAKAKLPLGAEAVHVTPALPMTLSPGDSARLNMRMNYQLDSENPRSRRANLHLVLNAKHADGSLLRLYFNGHVVTAAVPETGPRP